jgi:molybdopterin converting factor small subunit
VGHAVEEAPRIQVTVRFFAAAQAAAGAESQTMRLGPGATVADVIDGLAAQDGRLATVLSRCSYLCDGIAVRDVTTTLRSGATIDVLPPFAGG